MVNQSQGNRKSIPVKRPTYTRTTRIWSAY